ncbi:helix-turn-helix domain-containing protein [Paenibacillus senegalensis]|uniref:transposase n=1 Tax=Paenibacillus senegalensis TaxID=1465766 RepID=UPI000289B8D9|nr:transposase [Paenibacillus senegalensis]
MAGGRKSKYHTHVEPKLLLVEAWARDGLTIDQIADNLGVASSTLFDYKNKYPELSEALKRGQEVADVEVENSLYKRALGYRYDEVTKEAVTDPKTGNAIMVETKRVTKEVQPDVTAQIFWLKNRRPDKWRDKKDIDANHSGGLTVVFDDGMTKDE